ncbi:hypothetical protein QZH41_020485 [Actinostola sp. cb2023]|nr:hypothetical protein QZH41_020485 [Actinostola sp. cb2023]
MPQRPWQKIAADLMEFKKAEYLVVVDYYSRYIELSKLESPQFSSKEFSAFANDYGFSHITSSPGHASGNGEVERSVCTVKSSRSYCMQQKTHTLPYSTIEAPR